jgi:DMSO/TMAO reductase YedYZ molybdopterin-dependent catalytic subunit
MLTRRQLFTGLRDETRRRPPAEAVTPTAALFRQYARPTPPINPAFWSFSIGGAVRHPLSLSYNDMLSLPAADLPCTVICASNPPGGERIGHAVWSGVPMTSLLHEIAMTSNARFARLEAADGHVTGITLERLENALLACAVNGATLPPDQGFPVRLIVPGVYDHKMPRWITRIELTDTMPVGPWEARGWSPGGEVQTTSAITSPRRHARLNGTTTLRGYAFAGERTITAVELSVDGAPWMPVPFVQAAPNVWTRWQIEWTPTTGDHELRVRATDSTGFTQSRNGGRAFPSGSSAIHAVVVRGEG